MTEQRPPRVFISYRHEPERAEQADRVLALADRLREGGIDAVLDQYEMAPPEGWPTWCEREILRADFVLMVCTDGYRRCIEGAEPAGSGPGVLWEARLIRQLLYDEGAKTAKLVPVLLADETVDQVPFVVRARPATSSTRGRGSRTSIASSPISRTRASRGWGRCASWTNAPANGASSRRRRCTACRSCRRKSVLAAALADVRAAPTAR